MPVGTFKAKFDFWNPKRKHAERRQRGVGDPLIHDPVVNLIPDSN